MPQIYINNILFSHFREFYLTSHTSFCDNKLTAKTLLKLI